MTAARVQAVGQEVDHAQYVGHDNLREAKLMLRTEDVLKLVEANKIMASLIDRLFILLLQHETVEEIQKTDILPDVAKAAEIMNDYE